MSERSQATINARGRHESRRGSTDTTAPAPLHDSTMPDGALRLTPRQALRIRRAAGARPGRLRGGGGRRHRSKISAGVGCMSAAPAAWLSAIIPRMPPTMSSMPACGAPDSAIVVMPPDPTP